MKAQIIGDAALLYEEPNCQCPRFGKLESIVLFDTGEVEAVGKTTWVHVVLPGGTHGYIDGDTRIREIRRFRLEQEVIVRETWSTVSPVTKRLQPGDLIYAGRTVTNEGQEWAELFDRECRSLGFAGPVYRAERCDDITSIIRTHEVAASCMQSVIDAVQEQKWTIDSQSPCQLSAHTTPSCLSQTGVLNVLLGLVRFCFWPLIYNNNPQARPLPAKLSSGLEVTVSIHSQQTGSVLLIKATPISFLGSPICHSCTKQLIDAIKVKIQTRGKAPALAPTSQDSTTNRLPNGVPVPSEGAESPKVRFACPHCNSKLKCPAYASGRTTRCPGCGSPLVIPQGQQENNHGLFHQKTQM